MNASITHRLTEQGLCKLSGVNFGYNAKYLTYSLINQEANEITSFSITQVTEVVNSNRMEKLGFQKTLNQVREKGVVEKQLIIDRPMQTRKYMKQDDPQIDHQFDVWYFSKNIKSKLIAAAKRSS